MRCCLATDWGTAGMLGTEKSILHVGSYLEIIRADDNNFTAFGSKAAQAVDEVFQVMVKPCNDNSFLRRLLRVLGLPGRSQG